jgi:uncharacterized repeat protein (TIGR01451 family)
MAKGATSVLKITVQNNNNSSMTGVTFTDTYPAGLVNAATPAISVTPASCTYTTLTAAAGGNSFALTGGTIPLNTACIYSVDVTTPTEGSYLNDTGAVSSTNFGIGAAGSATLTVTPSSPTITKAFSPATINAGDTSVMTITLTNPNTTTAITGAAFTDVYPSGLVNTNTANAATTCVGSVSGVDNGSSLQLAGATIPANSSCTVTVNVTSALGGSYVNSTGPVSTTNASTGTAASGTLTVIGAPEVTKAFATSPIALNGTSVLTITLTNPNAGTALSGIAFTDTYPAGMTNTTVAGGTCTGTKTAVIAGNTVALSGGTLAASATCTVTVTVTSNTSGSLTNTLASGAVTSSGGNSAASASATLSVIAPPLVSKSFSPTGVATGLTNYTTLTVTLTNPNSVALTGVAFTDNYPTTPANLTNQTGGTLGNTCGGTAARTTGAPFRLTLTGGTIPANGSCTVSYNRVSSATAGTYTNTLAIGSVTSTNGGSNDVAASADLSVGGLGVSKAFTASSILTGASTRLTITITNNTGTARNISFTDTFPANLVIAATPNAGGSCTGTRTAVAGSGSLGFVSTANLASPGTCTVWADVSSATAGSYDNTIPVGGVTSSTAPATSNAVAASSTLTVMAPPTVSKAFSPAFIGLGGASTMTITLTNPNTTAITGAAFTDTYPADLRNNGSLVNNCSGSITVGTANPDTLGLSAGVIPASSSCTISISTTSSIAASYNNSLAIGAVTTTNAGSNTAAAGATLSVQAEPSLTFLKSVAIYWDPVNLFVNPKFIPGAIAEYTLFASNSGGPADANTIFVTDPIPANTALYVNDLGGVGSGPIQFVDGSTSSTLTYTFGALGNMTDDVDFSTNNGASWNTATPVAGADGCDPSINKIRINPKGTFVGNVPQPSFQLKFRVCVQ